MSTREESRLPEDVTARLLKQSLPRIDRPASIFTTIRYSEAMMHYRANQDLEPSYKHHQHDNPRTRFYMLEYHLARLRAAALYFDYPVFALKDVDSLLLRMWDCASGRLRESGPNPADGRVRVTIKDTGDAVIESADIPATDNEATYFPSSFSPPGLLFDQEAVIYNLYLCPTATQPSPYTRFKTDRREMYTRARVACNLPAQPTADPKEALLWNPERQLMEGSLTSVYFYRNGKWITPSLECGGNDGTTRRWALERGLCSEGILDLGDVKEGEFCWLSNGLRGFIAAKVDRQLYDRVRFDMQDGGDV